MTRKTITAILFAWLLVPFVLMTDLYPFFRFGMFAEPVKPTQTTEMLQLYGHDEYGSLHRFSPEMIGLSDNHFGYVLRHYLYQAKTKQLFSQIDDILSKRYKLGTGKVAYFGGWQILRTRYSQKGKVTKEWVAKQYATGNILHIPSQK